MQFMRRVPPEPLAARRRRGRGRSGGDPAARVPRRFRLVFNAVKSHFRAVETKGGFRRAAVDAERGAAKVGTTERSPRPPQVWV